MFRLRALRCGMRRGRHIRREENELFEDMQRQLSRKTLDALGAIVDARAVRIPI